MVLDNSLQNVSDQVGKKSQHLVQCEKGKLQEKRHSGMVSKNASDTPLRGRMKKGFQ